MTGLGCLERNFSRFVVAHFPDENDFWRLSQCRAQSRGKILRIMADFSLIDCRAFVGVKIFNGIFDCDDVVVLGLVNDVDNGGERRALTGPGWAGEQYQAIA